jgi:small subunit ribosomal protein S18
MADENIQDMNENETRLEDDSRRSGGNRDYRGGRDYRDGRDSRDGRDVRDDRDSKDGRPYRGGGGRKPFFKKKVCRFCTQDVVADYKNPDLLRRFVTERGKILPRRVTGTCAKHQRALSREIKRARVLAYLPFVKK